MLHVARSKQISCWVISDLKMRIIGRLFDIVQIIRLSLLKNQFVARTDNLVF